MIHDIVICEDCKTKQLVRMNDSLKIAQEIINRKITGEIKKAFFRKKDVTDKIKNLKAINFWSVDDWTRGFRHRCFLSDKDNKLCAFLMNAEKRESITLSEYLKNNL